jgi:hypothetical protein
MTDAERSVPGLREASAFGVTTTEVNADVSERMSNLAEAHEGGANVHLSPEEGFTVTDGEGEETKDAG